MNKTRSKQPSQKKQTRRAPARAKKRKRLRFAIGTALLVAAPAGGLAVGCGPTERDMVNTPAPPHVNVPADPEPETVETSNPVVEPPPPIGETPPAPEEMPTVNTPARQEPPPAPAGAEAGATEPTATQEVTDPNLLLMPYAPGPP